MAITFVSAGTFTEKASGITSLNVPYPTGIAAGDTLALIIGYNSSIIISAQTGWSTVLAKSSTGDTLVPGIYCGLKTTAAGTESGTNFALGSVPSAAGFAQILAFRGVDQTTPQDVAFSFLDKSTTTSANHPIPSVTTTMTGVTLVYGYIQNAATGASTPPTAPATFTETGDRVAQRNAATGYLIWSGSGATGTVTVVGNGTARGVAFFISLRPAAAAAVSRPRNIRTTNYATPRSFIW